MPRPRKNERVACRFFTWLLTRRDGVWRADGRSNQINVGRHSLATRDPAEARRLIAELDLTMAVQHGLADPAELKAEGCRALSFEDGRRLYEAHVGRAKLLGGVRPSSQKRYRAVLDKFLAYAASKGLTSWNQVTASTLEDYIAHLEDRGYAYRTQYLEATTLKQLIGWHVLQKHLPPECRIVLPLDKPQGTDTHCWRSEEVKAILEHCRTTPGLGWLAVVLTALTYTGLRISELIALRWIDLDFGAGMIRLVDESTSSRTQRRRTARTLKSGRSRSFPINDELLPVLLSITRHPDGFVFHGPAGGRLKADSVRRALIRDVLEPLAKKFPTPQGEIGFADGRLHSFRHLFVSLCAIRKVGLSVVMRWLGHRESRMVEHYFHLFDPESHRQMRRVVLDDDADGA